MIEGLYQVDVGYACAGVVVQKGFVQDAAPIFRWAIGKRWSTFHKWVKSKQGKVVRADHE